MLDRDSEPSGCPLPARQDPRSDGALARTARAPTGPARNVDRARVEGAAPNLDVVAVEVPAIGLGPQAVEQLELVLHPVGAGVHLGIRNPQRIVVLVVPAGAHP